MIVEVLDLLVDVAFEGCLVESVVEVLAQDVALVLSLHLEYQVQGLIVVLLLSALSGRVPTRVDLDVLLLLCPDEVALHLLDLSLPRLHVHLLLLLLNLHLLKLLVGVNVLIQEAIPMVLHANDAVLLPHLAILTALF